MSDIPAVFRLILQVSHLEKAAEFYSKLLGFKGRNIRGSRYYFDCGPVILALLDPSGEGEPAKPAPDYVYFSVNGLESAQTAFPLVWCGRFGRPFNDGLLSYVSFGAVRRKESKIVQQAAIDHQMKACRVPQLKVSIDSLFQHDGPPLRGHG